MENGRKRISICTTKKTQRYMSCSLRFALQVAKRRSYYSAKNIFHRIRWETMIEEKQSQFKIDDGWISHYARKFVNDYPKHSELFKFRERANSYHKGEGNE
jgi:hypothetical protein